MTAFRLTVLLLFSLITRAQVTAFYSPGLYFSRDKGPYLETNLTVLGKGLTVARVQDQYRTSATITFRLVRDSQVVKAERYNLNGPLFSDSIHPPAFLDCQRHYIENGRYTVVLDITDKQNPQHPVTIKSDIVVDFHDDQAGCSLIQPLESYLASSAQGNLVKSGYQLLPYNSHTYPEALTQIHFYFELYNADKVLGEGAPLTFLYYVETATDSLRLTSFQSFKTQDAAALNPLVASLDIANLGPGEYCLVVEARSPEGHTLKKEKFGFRRINRRMEITPVQRQVNEQAMAEYFGPCNNADTLQMYVECLWPIADNVDKDSIAVVAAQKDPQTMKKYAMDFWRRRAADTANPLQMWASYYVRVQTAMSLFKCGKQRGYYTDRGRVFLQYGPPNERAQQVREPNTFPYEIWQYNRITDQSNGIFLSNRRFVFVSTNLADDCYYLVHSDMRGEINNPLWRYAVSKRNYDGNLEKGVPSGSQYNQFDDLYKNPR